MKISRALVSVALLLLVPSCATRGLSDADRKAIRRVSISTIQLPGEPRLPRSGSPGAALIGTLIFLPGGAFIGHGLANLGNDMPAELARHLRQEKIDIAAYVFAEVRTHLEKQRIAIVADPAQADASLQITVIRYGLMPARMFADQYLPDLMLSCSLVRRTDSDPFWKGHAFLAADREAMATFEPRPRMSYMSDRALLESSFRKAAKTVTATALRGL